MSLFLFYYHQFICYHRLSQTEREIGKKDQKRYNLTIVNNTLREQVVKTLESEPCRAENLTVFYVLLLYPGKPSLLSIPF